MFEIKYSFSKQDFANTTSLDEISLRYDAFLGNVVIKEDNKQIFIDWDWIPLLDFALCFLVICEALSYKEQGQEEFEFTESNEKIFIKKMQDKIKINTSFSDIFLETNFSNFNKSIIKLYKNIIRDIVANNKNMQNDPNFFKFIEKSEAI